MFEFTRSDLAMLEQFVVDWFARELAVPNVPSLPREEALRAIHAVNAPLGTAVDTFLDRYDEWLSFHEEVKADGRQGHLSGEDAERLRRLVNAKEAAREELLEWKTRIASAR